MEITYEKEADAIYIEFSDAEFSKNKKIDDKTIIDLDKDGNLIGIELLDVSHRIPKDFLTNVKVKNITLTQEQVYFLFTARIKYSKLRI